MQHGVFFQQWLVERKNEALSISIIFKQLWEEEEEEEYPHYMPLLQHIISKIVHTARVAVFIPAPKVTLLSRRYGVFPQIPPTQRSVNKGNEMVLETSRNTASCLLFAEMLQSTCMPVVSYSVYGGTPLA
ncbi:hypothetical protein LSM04_006773 [Trypanosoma melophagium]|uniref:uncharacterized protein n=1 Tax=Trypanosoma melophagium TaxID=715481 RepID=UPI00351A98DB|nr:hypothetical protein LSM04_006773 [Trypanosoma melophagium]